MKLFAAIAAMVVMMLAIVACEEDLDGTPGPNGLLDGITGTATPTPGGGTTPGGTLPGDDGDAEEVEVSLEDTGGSGEYQFEPADFTFSTGDTVNFVLTAETEMHTFTVEALGIDTEVQAGETVEFTHTFDQAGTFELVCIPHELQGMVGTITVE